MKGDIWYLKDPCDNDRVIAKFELTDDYYTGNLWTAVSWDDEGPFHWHFVAEVYAKWDACTHWWFKGELFDPEEDAKTHDNEIDAYYHLCGPHIFLEHIRTMCFMWVVASRISQNYNYYNESKLLNHFIDDILRSLVIERADAGSDEAKKLSREDGDLYP